jgi:hypothetical protein
MGLESSIGKTYFTREFVEINSRQFTRVEDDPDEVLVTTERGGQLVTLEDGRQTFSVRTRRLTKRILYFRVVKFVNLGLLVGLKRSAGKVGLDALTNPVDGLAARYTNLLNDCPSHLQRSVHKHFINHHRQVLRGTRLPWFVPTWLGGVGLIGFETPSEVDCRIAAAILWNWNKRRPTPTTKLAAPWKTWELAQKSLPRPLMSETRNGGTENYTSIVSDKCVDLLFDSTITLKHLYKVARSDKEWIERLAHNERLWELKRYYKLPPPMTREDMLFRPKYESYDERLNAPSLSTSVALDLEPTDALPPAE